MKRQDLTPMGPGFFIFFRHEEDAGGRMVKKAKQGKYNEEDEILLIEQNVRMIHALC